MMANVLKSWKYYVPERGETADDARVVYGSGPHQSARFVAKEAAEQLFSPVDHSLDWEPLIVLIAPHGTKHGFRIEYEAVVSAIASAADLPEPTP